MKRTLTAPLTALTALALAAGCTSAASSPAHRSAPPTRQHTTVHHPTPHEPTVVISEKDAGHVVHVRLGGAVHWVLHSTYWTMGPLTGDVLVRPMGAVSAGSSRSCVPGQGCGTVEAYFRAVARGRVTLSAHRISCGEALRCVGKQGSFSVTVIVD